jgi:oligoribonuclease NrnB/cAMP/cGMP phosphodiesterase (DHH superfamily)
MDIIYSHGHCPDGFTAALIAKRRYPEAEVIFLDHGADHTTALSKAIFKDVLMLDFSLRTREENDSLAERTHSFRILDHHKTAEAVLKDAPYAVFDMKRSGAGLTWDYLFGKDAKQELTVENDYFTYPLPKDRPWYVDYVEDRDLWNWKLPRSKEVCAYLGTLPLEFEAWKHLDGTDWLSAANQGTGALAHIDHYVREAVKQAQIGTIGGASIAVLNVPYLNCSEIGDELAKTTNFGLTWFERGDGMIQFSLRSIGDFDVSEVAKKMGGGGHKNAAGFQLTVPQGRALIDSILGRKEDLTSY